MARRFAALLVIHTAEGEVRWMEVRGWPIWTIGTTWLAAGTGLFFLV
jgi:hypothetical protein